MDEKQTKRALNVSVSSSSEITLNKCINFHFLKLLSKKRWYNSEVGNIKSIRIKSRTHKSRKFWKRNSPAYARRFFNSQVERRHYFSITSHTLSIFDFYLCFMVITGQYPRDPSKFRTFACVYLDVLLNHPRARAFFSYFPPVNAQPYKVK